MPVKTIDIIYGIVWFLIVLLFVAAIINFEQGTVGLISRYEFLTILLAKFGFVGAALSYLHRSDNGNALQAQPSRLQSAPTPESVRQHPWH